MENRNINIDDFFRHEMGGAADTPPADVWSALEKRLDADNKRRRFGWWWVAGILLLAGGVYIGNGYLNSEKETIVPAITNTGLTPAPATMPTATPSVMLSNKHGENTSANTNTTLATSSGNSSKPAALDTNHLSAIAPVLATTTPKHSHTKHKTSDTSIKVIATSNKQESIADVPIKKQLVSTAITPVNTIKPIPVATTAATVREQVKDNTSTQTALAISVPATALPKQSRRQDDKLTPIVTAPAVAANTEKVTGNAPATAKQGQQPLNIVAAKNAPVASEPSNNTASKAIANAGAPAKDTIAAANTTAPAGDPNAVHFHITAMQAGLNLGIGRGTQSFTATNIVIAPFIELDWSKKVSVVLMPGVKYNATNTNPFGDKASPYYTNVVDTIIDMGTAKHGSETYHLYGFRQSYDSITASHSITRSYWEVEMPILLRYKVTPKLTLSAGPVFTFGSMARIQSNIQKMGSFTNTGMDSTVSPNTFAPTHANNMFHHEVPAYDSLLYQNVVANNFHWGFRFDITYYFSDRLYGGLSVQQNLSDNGFSPNQYITNLYTQPYFRFNIGYVLFKNKKIANAALDHAIQ